MSVKLRNVYLLVIMMVLTACGDSTQTAPAAQTQLTTSPATTTAINTSAPTQSTVTIQPLATTQTAITTQPPTTVAPTQPLTTANTATSQATQTSAPTVTTAVVQTTTAASDTQAGLVLFRSQGCAGCHGGDKATGQLGPPLNNLDFPEEGLLRQVRSGAKPMPAYSAQKLPDDDVKLIYAYLISLKGK